MGNFGEQYCALCYSAICNGNLKKIENVTKDILEVILLKLNLVDNGKQVMCEVCSQKVIQAFDFKSMCLYTDNTIVPYVGDETECSVDLREIYAKEKGMEPLLELLNQHKICRLCMQLIRGEFVSECDVNIDMIQSYIPEINFSVVKDPTVCRQCFDSLDSHSSFIRKCLEEEQKVKPLLLSSIKIEEIEIKSESDENEHELSQTVSTVAKSENEKVSVKTENIEVETEENNESDTSNREEEHKEIFEVEDNKCKPKRHRVTHKKRVTEKIYKCEKCDYTSPSKKNFTSHQQRHNKIKIHNCDICSYKTNRKFSLTLHQLLHKNTSEVNMFKCIYCKYESKFKQTMRGHFITRHGENLIDPKENAKVKQLLNTKDPLPVKMHKCNNCLYKTVNERHFLTHQSKLHKKSLLECEECDYRTMSNFCLQTHKLTHKDPSEVKTYNCNNCNYKSKYRSHIIRHQLIHLSPEQVPMHKCIYCSYESKHKEAVKNHIGVHHRDLMLDPKENLKVTRILNLKKPLPLNVYKCDECPYQTIYKGNFMDHQLTHRKQSEVQMYKCDTCDWETRYKKGLTDHKWEHKRGHKVQMHKCDICDFAAKWRSTLRYHKFIHKNASEVRMYKCHNCDYETKRKKYLINHQLLHKRPSQISMYKCDICEFTTKHKNSITYHKTWHKNLSEYNCDMCDYTSKRKSSLAKHRCTHKNAKKV